MNPKETEAFFRAVRVFWTGRPVACAGDAGFF
jgi:hypothetical protein